ncbi:MAG: hypothetical protein ISS94_05765 [Candidatus Syntrophoarchaeum sp.]|nr:hypothetical protein [Methanomicrobia archaeon]MBL7118270.1 hypothetical protein [Candidatus Syntrophoarchaeum sp.]
MIKTLTLPKTILKKGEFWNWLDIVRLTAEFTENAEDVFRGLEGYVLGLLKVRVLTNI